MPYWNIVIIKTGKKIVDHNHDHARLNGNDILSKRLEESFNDISAILVKVHMHNAA